MKVWRLAGAMLAAALVTASCSAGGSGGSGDTGGATGTPIRIGTVGDYTGQSAQTEGTAHVVLDAWVKATNAAGGVAGHPIELYSEDNAGNAAQGLTAVRRLVEKDQVVAIVGQSDASPQWGSYVSQKKVPVVGGATVNAVDYTFDPNWYAQAGNIATSFYGIAQLAAKVGPKFGALYCAEAAGCAAVTSLVSTLGKPLGVELGYSAGLAASTPDFTAQCLAMKNGGVNSFGIFLQPALHTRVADQCKQLGYTAPTISTGELAGTNLKGVDSFRGAQFVDVSFPWFDRTSPGRKAMYDAIQKYHPEIGTPELPMNAVGGGGWVAGELFKAAIEASGVGPNDKVDSATVKKGLYALKGATLGGLAVPLTYTPDKPTPFNCYWAYKMDDAGAFASMDDLKPTCADAAGNDAIAKVAAGFAPRK